MREWVTLDLSIVRGLAYYTGIVFELFDAKGELRAICGGGRYDKLLKSLGGVDLPALGFGMGDVVLGELLRDRGLMPPATLGPQVWVAAETAAMAGRCAPRRDRAAPAWRERRVRAARAGAHETGAKRRRRAARSRVLTLHDHGDERQTHIRGAPDARRQSGTGFCPTSISERLIATDHG